MSIEGYFRTNQMDWFKEDQHSRYSPFHWNEIRLQTLEASKFVADACTQSENPTIGIIGFGFGRETAVLWEQGIHTQVLAIDVNHSRFIEARAIRPDLFDSTLNPVVASMNKIPLESESFAVTMCLETMMHSDNPALTLSELTRVTKVGGLILFNMSTNLGVINTLITMLRIEGIPRIVQRVTERMTHDTNSSSLRTTLYTPEEIDMLIQENHGTTLLNTKRYLYGVSTYIAIQKIDQNWNKSRNDFLIPSPSQTVHNS